MKTEQTDIWCSACDGIIVERFTEAGCCLGDGIVKLNRSYFCEVCGLMFDTEIIDSRIRVKEQYAS